MKNKKGTHVGLVLSFSLFVIFLVFVYFIISSSIKVENSKQESLDKLELNILKEIKENVWVIRIYDNSGGCVKFDVPETISGGEIVTQDSNGEIVSSDLSSGIISFSGGGFRKTYYAKGLENPQGFSGSSCVEITKQSEINEEIILEKKILQLIENITGNYSNLRETLDVSSEQEFDISFEYSNGTIVESEQSDPQVEIFSQEKNIYYLSNQGKEEKGILRTRIW